MSDWAVLQARATTISAALLVASSRIVALGLRGVLTRCVVSLAQSDRVPVCESGLKSLRSFVNHVEGDGKEMIEPLCQVTGVIFKVVVRQVFYLFSVGSDSLCSGCEGDCL